ncbi:DUF2147 domain-containing protein [Jiella marina]|uniref:DUF2147 domain-containing protein n=1 Tax=Jiella sp. LLJ827 TaxID=2917712 RepID=UPI00210100BE|nr:DUF2147 domain-containing protein [Jiella sp. LLJ827]MCQ0990087.1 DUF2147 domain-containing protein [Jiella sp. LLJ827]
MRRVSTTSALIALCLAAGLGHAQASPQIVGDWISEDGTQIEIAPCGAGFCARIASGRYSGESVATVSGSLPELKGQVRDPRSNDTYDGGLRLVDGHLELRGCLARVFCRTVQTWTRP